MVGQKTDDYQEKLPTSSTQKVSKEEEMFVHNPRVIADVKDINTFSERSHRRNMQTMTCRRERCQNCSSTPRNHKTTNLRMRKAEQDHSIVLQPWCRAYSRIGRIRTAHDTKRSPAEKTNQHLSSDTSQFLQFAKNWNERVICPRHIDQKQAELP